MHNILCLPGPGLVGIDLDTSTGKLYWGTENNWGIYTAPSDNRGPPAFVYTTNRESHDVEVDEANSRIFFGI